MDLFLQAVLLHVRSTVDGFAPFLEGKAIGRKEGILDYIGKTPNGSLFSFSM